MNKHFDIAIIGGGASGLALLYAMHLQGVIADYTIALIEPESKDSNDRTWCFWSDESDPAWQMFSPCVSHKWDQVDSAYPSRQQMFPYHYAQIRSSDFYQFVRDALDSYPKIESYKAHVQSLETGEPHILNLDDERQLSADLVFDSRPPQLNDPELIWQSFVGYRIKTEALKFETDVCRLMDFEVAQEDKALQFMYLLPTSRTEALIEFTRFGKAILKEEESKPIITEYLKAMDIHNFEILEKEVNKIPMSLSLNSTEKRHPEYCNYVPIGVRAGVVKASTGFAFKKIAQHSWDLAIAIKNQDTFPTPGHSRQHWVYDELLLNIFNKKNSPIVKLFVRLFKVHPIDRILRFIDEKSSFKEDFIIMYKMPWSPFFWSIAKSIQKRLGARN